MESPRPERVGSGGKTGISLVVVVVVTLIGLAVAKPWAGTGPVPPRPAELAASPSALPGPSQALPTASEVAGPTPVPVDPITTIDWQAVGALLRPHDAWGIRTLVYRPDNTLREQWTPIRSSDTDVQAAVNNADSYAVLGHDGTIVALGVTTPLGDAPLDVRAWRDTSPSANAVLGWRNLPLTADTPSGDPSARLLRLPNEWSSVNGWTPGEYELDVLLETSVLHVHLWLSGDEGPVPPLPQPRDPPTLAQLRTMDGAPGGFIASGTASVSYLFIGLPPTTASHDEHDAWLALTSDEVFWVPGVFERQSAVLGPANLLGAAVPAGQVLLSANVSELSPVTRDLGAAEILAGAPGPDARPGAVAVLRAADPLLGFPDAVYRIDAKVRTDHGTLTQSWDLPVLARPTSTESPLLTADRGWSAQPSTSWAVLAPGYNAVPVTPEPGGVASDPGATCHGGATFGKALDYVGIEHPGVSFDRVTVTNMAEAQSANAVPVPVQVSQLAGNVVALRPVGTVWPSGRYAISLHSGSSVQGVTVCIH